MDDIKRDTILLELKEGQNKSNNSLIEIATVLKGYNGNPGLCKIVDDNCKSINRIWIALAILGASISGGAYGIVKLLIG